MSAFVTAHRQFNGLGWCIGLAGVIERLMPINIELKARVRDWATQTRLAEAIADGAAERLEQVDSFFHAAQGRLKLRQFGAGPGELIAYQRDDRADAKSSSYLRVAIEDPPALCQTLALALGIRGVVKKTRWVYLVGQTRIHLDNIEGLGEFLELEVVLSPNQPPEEGQRIATELKERLGIMDEELVAGAYVDLIMSQSANVIRAESPFAPLNAAKPYSSL